MKAEHLLEKLDRAKKRALLVGEAGAGVIASLDLEGRLFAVFRGEVVNRVNEEAIAGQSTRGRYFNPGGDGLWPAPEGTALGYQYAAGSWRVPPGLTGARYVIAGADNGAGRAGICAEVDLVNNQGLGIPALFKRQIAVLSAPGGLKVQVVESIAYLGRRALPREECLLAPWSLCQFDSGPGCEVVFPCASHESVWDLYDEPSDGQRTWSGPECRTRTDGSQRYQIAIDAGSDWIEYRDPGRGLTVRRQADPLPVGQFYIDIRDAAPEVRPGGQGVRYSVYSDPTGFMEIEAAGGCPPVIEPGQEMSVRVHTVYTFANPS